MSERLHFVLAHDIKSLNTVYSADRFKRAKIAGREHDTVAWLVYEALGRWPDAPLPSPVAVHIAAYSPYPKAPDNIPKLLLDGLVLAGVLENDSYKDIVPLTVESHRCQKAETRLEITITSLDGGKD